MIVLDPARCFLTWVLLMLHFQAEQAFIEVRLHRDEAKARVEYLNDQIRLLDQLQPSPDKGRS